MFITNQFQNQIWKAEINFLRGCVRSPGWNGHCLRNHKQQNHNLFTLYIYTAKGNFPATVSLFVIFVKIQRWEVHDVYQHQLEEVKHSEAISTTHWSHTDITLLIETFRIVIFLSSYVLTILMIIDTLMNCSQLNICLHQTMSLKSFISKSDSSVDNGGQSLLSSQAATFGK